MTEENKAGGLCLECGLCCNGVIFANVKLQANDDVARLRALGLPLSGKKFLQPCRAWKDCQCRIYADRPNHCRSFECLLFKRLEAEEVDGEDALRTVRSAREKVAQIEALLSQLDDNRRDLDLRARFLATLKRLETTLECRKEDIELLSELTLAFHELDHLLRQHFYDAP